MTRRAQQRLLTAEDKVSDKTEEIEELEDRLGEDIQGITRRWDDAAKEIEELDVGLEKTDVRVQDMTLFWAPV